jgi:Leucine-rich repeat (LRR) protein
MLYASPMCKKLKVLKMSGLPLVDFTVTKFKKDLKELTINQCRPQEQRELDLSDWKLERLEAIGISVNLNLPESLWVLVLNDEVPIDNLKAIRHLSLTQLKICLVEGRKNIKSIFNSLTLKDNPAKVFA